MIKSTANVPALVEPPPTVGHMPPRAGDAGEGADLQTLSFAGAASRAALLAL